MRKIIGFVLVVLIAGCLACAGTGGQRVHRDRYVITMAEIAGMKQANSAWDLVRLLRPGLLERDQRRYVGMMPRVTALVYVNGTRAGFKNQLQNIANLNIVEIRYIDGIEARTRYGSDSAGGVFMVTIR